VTEKSTVKKSERKARPLSLDKFKDEDKKDLKKMIEDPGVDFDHILQDSRFSNLTQRRIRHWANKNGYRVRMNGRSKQIKKTKTYENRLDDLIHSGVLRDQGIDSLLQTIKAEFPDSARGLKKGVFVSEVEGLVWEKNVENQLKNIVGHGLPTDRFEKAFSYIPKKMIAIKEKELSGISNVKHPVTFLRGLGRIGQIEGLDANFELPKTSLTEPFVIDTQGENVTVMCINGANIGLKHERLIKENPVRRALDDANRRRDAAVIITNPMDVEVKKAAGPPSVFRALFSGQNINIDLLDPSYQEKARKIKSDATSTNFVYETTSEKILNILSGWSKIIKRRKGGLEYEGPIYVILGHKEKKMIAAAAYWELRYWTIVEWHKIGAEIRLVKSAIASSEKRGLPREEKKRLEGELKALIDQQARTIISNIDDEVKQNYYRKVLHFIVQKFEEAVPNAKVISQGTAYIKIADEIVEFTIPSHVNVRDGLLAEHVKKHGPRVLLGELPRAVIICHPYALNMRMTVRESVENGKRSSVQFYIAPIAVDHRFLTEALEESDSNAHPIAKAIFNGQFKSGVLRLNINSGMLNVDDISIDSLPISSNRATRLKDTTNETYHDNEYIWIMTATDPHFGSRAREEFWCDSRQSYLGVSDAAIQMMRDAKLFNTRMPIHFYNINDDVTQGNHFDTHKQPDHYSLSYANIEAEFRKMMNALKKAEPDRIKEIQRFTLDQFRARGSDYLQEQIEQVFDRHLEPNMDFWHALLLNNLKSGLMLRGVSEHTGVKYDSRDAGFINFGTGNHFESTVDRNLTEGFIYARYVRLMLRTFDDWQKKENLLDKWIASPLYGNKFFAWATISAPGGYEWGLEFRSDPPRLSNWSDPLLAAVNNDASRGDYAKFMSGRVTLKTYGDKHFFAAVSTRYAFYHMCAAGTHTDLYGERGFPPNNTGVSFVGLPANGPNSGPILLRTLRVEHFRQYFEGKLQIDWGNFLPNPI
jgi:hypothetical protein